MGVDLTAVLSQRLTDLAAEGRQGTVFAQRFLEVVEGFAHAIDQWAGTAEVDGAGTAARAIAEAIVRAIGAAVAVTPTGVNAALEGELLGTGRQKHKGWVN